MSKNSISRPTLKELQEVQLYIADEKDASEKLAVFYRKSALVATAATLPFFTPILLAGIGCLGIYSFQKDQHGKLLKNTNDILVSIRLMASEGADMFNRLSHALEKPKSPEVDYQLCKSLILFRDENIHSLRPQHQQFILQQQCLYLIGAFYDETDAQSFFEQQPFYHQKALTADPKTLSQENMVRELKDVRQTLISSDPNHPACQLFEDYHTAKALSVQEQTEDKMGLFNILTLQTAKMRAQLKKYVVEFPLQDHNFKLAEKYRRVGSSFLQPQKRTL